MKIILGNTAGFCYGVKRAVDGAKQEIENNNKDIYCLGEIVHNKDVIEDLEKSGITFVEDIEKSKGTTIIRAHGVPKEVYEIAKEEGINLKDYTCPNVLKIHKIVKEYAQKGYYIFLCGSKVHPENIGTISYCGKYYSIIEKENDICNALENLNKSKIEKVLLISQTTYSLERFYKIKEIIKNKLPVNIFFEVNNTICKATELRQEETKEIAQKVDYMIIIGGKNSSNTKKLYEIAKVNCKNSICVENIGDLDVAKAKQYQVLGIMAGASTPKESIQKIIDAIN